MPPAAKRSRTEAMADDESVDTPRFGEEGAAKGGIFSRFGARLFNSKGGGGGGGTGGSCSSAENVNPGNSSASNHRFGRSGSGSVAPTKDVDANVNDLPSIGSTDLDPSTMKPAFVSCPDFATEELGAFILFASDEFSGVADNLLKSTAHDPTASEKTDYGVVGDWWGTRRRRREGHEWAVIQFGEPVFIRGFDIDTHGTPAFTPNISVEAGYFTNLDEEVTKVIKRHHPVPGSFSSHQLEPLAPQLVEEVQDVVDSKDWIELVPIQRIRYTHDGHHYFGVKTKQEERRLTHIRVNLMPDGAVSRFRAYGETLSTFGNLKLLASESSSKTLNLLDPKLGAWPLWASSSRDATLPNLISCSLPRSCRDGWCTQSQQFRQPLLFEQQNQIKYSSDDVVVLKLAGRCIPSRIEIDTSYFLGDAPYAVTVEAIDSPEMLKLPMLQQIAFFRNRYREGVKWVTVKERMLIKPNAVHTLDITMPDPKAANSRGAAGRPFDFESQTYHQIQIAAGLDAITHIRISVIPDGGLSRIRLWGNPVDVLPSDLTRGGGGLCGGFALEPSTAVPGSVRRPARRRSTMLLYNNLDSMFQSKG